MKQLTIRGLTINIETPSNKNILDKLYTSSHSQQVLFKMRPRIRLSQKYIHSPNNRFILCPATLKGQQKEFRAPGSCPSFGLTE